MLTIQIEVNSRLASGETVQPQSMNGAYVMSAYPTSPTAMY